MIKLSFIKELAERNPMRVFNNMSYRVQNAVIMKEPVDIKSFSHTIHGLCDVFESSNQRHLINYKGAGLAEQLTNRGAYGLSSIIYGSLIKINKNNPGVIEELATKALEVAKKQKDKMHILARRYELTLFYRSSEPGSSKHLHSLYEQESILKEILRDYRGACRSYNTIKRPVKPIETFEFMLSSTEMEIAKIVMDKYPLQAIERLERASIRMKRFGEGTMIERIKGLEDMAYSRL